MIRLLDRLDIISHVREMQKNNSPCHRSVYDAELCNWVGRELNVRALFRFKRDILEVLVNRSLEHNYV